MDISIKKLIQNVTSSIVAIVIMFSVIATMGLVFFKTTLINENTYKNLFEKVGTYNKVHESIESNVSYALVVNNIPNDVLNGIISKEEVVEMIDSTTDSFIGFLKGKGSVVSYDIDEYKSRIDKGINKYLRDNNMYLNESQNNDIENMKTTILNIIDSELQIINFSELAKSDTMIMVSKVINILDNYAVIIGVIFANIILLSVFFMIWKKRKARAYAWIGYTLVASGMIVFLLSFSGYLSGFYEYVIIAIPYVAETVGFIIKKYLLSMSMIAVSVVLIGIFSMSFYWKHLYKRYKTTPPGVQGGEETVLCQY